MATRDLKVRYAQTYLGILWGLFQPILGLAAVFVLFFKLAGINSGTTPYLVFALSGLVIWNYFYYLVTQSASGLVNMQAMIRKIYFPRLSIPFSKAIVGFVDLIIGLLLLVICMLYFNQNLLGLWMLLPVAILTGLAGLGFGLAVSAISLRYRDLQQILPFLLQILFFLSPVAYPVGLLQKLIPEKLMWLAYLNPVSGILEIWRWALFDMEISPYVNISLLICVILFMLGLGLFNRAEQKMADLI